MAQSKVRDFPQEKYGDFPVRYVKLPEGSARVSSELSMTMLHVWNICQYFS